ncbi:Acetate CoA-transferase subunit alpha [Koleobacter methoxysyntrophicus]|uniref:Acetate CoA-transferase subunit alpha n=1 Tax=Koleobacter methoxysyntrophicus TaxID=2751313 RepID=A0A8A0RN94_9FIRM|nr:acetate CoA-transferase subunit alpha [Koleobacter methoxysyntrophicus]QSQ09058.1 Acetate CoA-transferase subunit alpha [Koleobacter methoxysyntrophicus]
MEKIRSIKDAVERIKDGMTVMVGGFLGVGTPEALVDALVAKGVKNLTVICNDSAFPDRGIGKLIVNKQIKKLITSHIGTNPETGRQMNEGETEVELVPQGTLAERIRAAGAGLGGILTPTGVGTIVEQGKKKLEINGKEYLLELPIKADIALLKAEKADKKGNLIYRKSARNFNPIMATAADFVIVQVDEIVDVGEIDPDDVMTPGIFVDMIVRGDN